MDQSAIPFVPKSQKVFGEVVYWITVISAIICILGPMIAFIDMDNNVLNPHFVFQKLFDGQPSASEEVVLTADVSAGSTVLMVEDTADFKEKQTILIENDLIRETATVASVDKDAGTIVLTEGLKSDFTANEETIVTLKTIWDPFDDTAEEGPKGGHFWKSNFTTGDGFTQFGLVLGCSVGIFAMISAALIFMFKEKSFGWGAGAIWIAFMVSVSAIGLVSIE